MTAELVTLTDTSEGFATVLTARGPGTGINRMQVTLRNEAAITKYGAREVVEDFPDAVSTADLLSKAQARLAEVSDPAKFQQLTVRVAGHTEPFRLGQRVRVSDGELGFTTTAKIVGIDTDEDGSTLTLGDAPASLLDVINAKEAEEKRDIALGLPAPISVQLVPTPTGMTVLVTLGANSRAIGVEVHVSPVNGFIPDVSTLAAKGPGVRFEIEGLATAIRHFVRVRAYDDRGNFSPYTDQISTAARGVGTAELVVGQIDITNAERANAALSVKTGAGTEVLRLGNITGKSGVPSGTQFGLWGALGAGVFIQGAPRLITAGYETISINFGTVAANTTYINAVSKQILGSTVVPAGKNWLFFATPSDISQNNDRGSIVEFNAHGEGIWNSGGTGVAMVLPARTYEKLSLLGSLALRAFSAGALTVSMDISYLIFEIDA